MAFSKIQPQQVQLATFLSPSGDFTASDLTTGVEINLSRNLSGDFNFAHGLTVSSSEVLTASPDNSFSEGSLALGGIDNVISGTYNLLLNGSNNTQVSGLYNTILNARYTDFGSGAQNNTVLAGYQVGFEDEITGAVVLADHDTSPPLIDTNHSLTVSFVSGVRFVNGNVSFDSDYVYSNAHLTVEQNHTGIFSGDIDVFGDAYVTGDVNITGDLNVNSFSTFQTGAIFSGQLTGHGDMDLLSDFRVTGDSIFNGQITGNNEVHFYNDINFHQGTFTCSAETDFITDVTFHSNTTLSGSSPAASHLWITGGLNAEGLGLVREVRTEGTTTEVEDDWRLVFSAGQGGTYQTYITGNYIDIPVSGSIFRIFGVWNPS